MQDPDAVPYFLWDLGLTVRELREGLVSADRARRDDLITRLLREANTRDVWLFLDWKSIEEAWPRIERRLGRSRAIWQMMREHRRSHGYAASTD